MWEESLIETKGRKTRKWWKFPLAVFLHALFIGIMIGVGYWGVEAVQPPDIPVTLLTAPPPPPPPPPAAAPPKKEAAPKPEPQKPKEPPKVTPKPEIVQPTVIPEIEPEEEPTPTEIEPDPTPQEPVESAADAGIEGGAVEGGVAGGVEGGVEGGVVGGVAGGVPGGVVGGVPEGVIGGKPQVSDETPQRITAAMSQPVLVKRVEPPYPEVARKARIEGVVVLEAIITKTGTVEGVKVIRSLHPAMDETAVKAVKQWKYKPATLSGKPVKVYFTVTVTFRLK